MNFICLLLECCSLKDTIVFQQQQKQQQQKYRGHHIRRGINSTSFVDLFKEYASNVFKAPDTPYRGKTSLLHDLSVNSQLRCGVCESLLDRMDGDLFVPAKANKLYAEKKLSFQKIVSMIKRTVEYRPKADTIRHQNFYPSYRDYF